MPTQTTVFNLNKPTVAGDADTWGGSTGLNGTIDKIESAMKATATTGSANAYVLSSGLSLTAYATGQVLRIIANFTNSGAATINVDGLGAKNITKTGATALASGDLVSGRIYTLAYDGTQFQVVEINSLDATLSTIAALTPTTDQSVYFTGTDTAATYSLTSAGRSMVGAASATAQTALLNAFTGDSGSGGIKGLVPAPGAGDSAKVLKGNGAWGTPSGVGWGEPVGTWTYSSAVTTIDFTGLSGYSELLVVFDQVSSGSGAVSCRVSTDNGASFIATNYNNSATSDRFTFFSSSPTSPYRLMFTLYDFNVARRTFADSTARAEGTQSQNTAAAHNAIRLLIDGAATFTGGTIRVYGKV